MVTAVVWGALCGSGAMASEGLLYITGNMFRRCGKDAQQFKDNERSCHMQLKRCAGLSMVGNVCRAGPNDDGKGQFTPQVGFIIRTLSYSVIKDNAMYHGYMKDKIVDLGGHGEELIINDNLGSPRTQ